MGRLALVQPGDSLRPAIEYPDLFRSAEGLPDLDKGLGKMGLTRKARRERAEKCRCSTNLANVWAETRNSSTFEKSTRTRRSSRNAGASTVALVPATNSLSVKTPQAETKSAARCGSKWKLRGMGTGPAHGHRVARRNVVRR